ncbi:MAG: pyrroloquinoline quinone biosynthesis protein PqqE [Propylenella sp.]
MSGALTLEPAAAPATVVAPAPEAEIPLGLLAEITHRCPLQCPYCSNPVELERPKGELAAAEWARVFDEAAALGVVQLHVSGGEPLVRMDVADIVRAARQAGLYANLITAAVGLTPQRADALAAAGVEHVQISIQDATSEGCNRVTNYAKAFEKKLAAAKLVTERGLPLTVNAVVHRQNLDNIEAIIALAESLGAHRLEVAHAQYYGWGYRNRAALMPEAPQVEAATHAVAAARERLKGRMLIDYVVPDYYARYPKPCMGGWGRQFLTVTPTGKALPCHAAATIPGLSFDNVRERPLDWIWRRSDAFNRFRGKSWMREPCRSCPRAEEDFGGCRCQAFMLTGNAENTDPVCSLSPHQAATRELAAGWSREAAPEFVYRRYQ